MREGTVLGDRFRIEERVGHGGHGDVHRGRDLRTGQPVAIKILRTRIQAGPQRSRFEREAAILGDLHHPAIVTSLGRGTTPSGAPWIAMEWLEGITLGTRLRSGAIPVPDALRIARTVAEALGVAHAKSIVHRDVKPDNVFLVGGDLGRPKLLDFGVARADWSDRVTATGAIIGTAGYMAPEQVRGDADVGPRVDVFSLGCVLFEMLTGRRAFEGETPLAILARTALEDAPKLSEHIDVPPQVEAVVVRMLARDAAERPADGSAVASLLAAITPSLIPPSAGRPTTGEHQRRHSRSSVPFALTTREQRIVTLVGRRGGDGTVSAVENEIAREHGGVAWPFPDGSLVIELEGSDGPADRAARAARCALALAEAGPEARVAIATGRSDEDERRLIGEAADRLGRLFAAPDPEVDGCVRVDEVTATLLGSGWALDEDDHGRLLLTTAVAATRGQTHVQRPLIGRDAEMSMLQRVIDRCASEERAHAVLIAAPAGRGKTHLRRELVAWCRRDGPGTAWIGRGEMLASPFATLASALREIAGVRPTDTAEVVLRKVAQRATLRLAPESRDRVAALLASTLGVPLPASDDPQLTAAQGDPLLRGDLVARAWLEVFDAETREAPLLLVLDDLHNADAASLAAVGAALRLLHDRALVAIALARHDGPDPDGAVPLQWREVAVQVLSLEPLSPVAAEEVARELLGDLGDADTVRRIVEQAGGDPFFMEQLAAAVVEGRGAELPETVLAVVEARLAAIDPSLRRLLRAASILGPELWTGGVATLLGDAPRAEVESALLRLVERGVIDARRTSRFAGENQWGFRHPLVRDAAYAMLTEGDRALGHRLAAAWLGRAGESDERVLAEHLERGGEKERAAALWARVADQALAGSDMDAVTAIVDRGLACGATGVTRGQLLVARAFAYRWGGRPALAREAATEALQLVSEDANLWGQAATEVAQACLNLSDWDGVESIATQVALRLEHGRRSKRLKRWAARIAALAYRVSRTRTGDRIFRLLERDPPDELSPMLLARAERARRHQDLAGFFRHAGEAIEELNRIGDARQAAMMQMNIGMLYGTVGAFAAAERLARDAAESALRLGAPLIAHAATLNRAYALSRLGRAAEARKLLVLLIVECGKRGNARVEVAARFLAAELDLAAGHVADAEREARAACTPVEHAEALRPYALATLSRALLARGKLVEARERALEAKTILERLGEMEGPPGPVYLAWLEVLAANGEKEEAAQAAAEARTKLMERAASLGDDELRRSFLEVVPEHARILELASAWVDRP